jgi:hypothetical protein
MMPACGSVPFNFPGDFALTSDQAVTCPACLALGDEVCPRCDCLPTEQQPECHGCECHEVDPS